MGFSGVNDPKNTLKKIFGYFWGRTVFVLPPLLSCNQKTMKQQLEMKLEQRKPCRRPYPSHPRRARARWWFDQMKAVVDKAPDWPAEANGTADKAGLDAKASGRSDGPGHPRDA